MQTCFCPCVSVWRGSDVSSAEGQRRYSSLPIWRRKALRPLAPNLRSAPVIWSISIWCWSHPAAVRLGCRAGSWLEAEVSIKGFLLRVMRGRVGWEQWKNISSIYKGPFNRRGSSVSLAGTWAVRQPVLPPPPPLSITRAASPALLHLTRRDKLFSLFVSFI